jgi:hypothetical protein
LHRWVLFYAITTKKRLSFSGKCRGYGDSILAVLVGSVGCALFLDLTWTECGLPTCRSTDRGGVLVSLPACQPVGKGQNPCPRLSFAAGQTVGGCGLRPNMMGSSYRIRPIPRLLCAIYCSCVIIVLVDMAMARALL